MDTCVVCAIFADSGPFHVTINWLTQHILPDRGMHAGVHVCAPVERVRVCLTTLQEL